MWTFLPNKQETRLVSLNQEQLLEKFEKHVKPVDKSFNREDSTNYLFNGVWSSDEFSISLKLKSSNNFIPIIHGKYMDSDKGILIQLNYVLFPATKKLLMFWTILTLLITLFFIGLYQAWIYGAISFGFCLVNYILSIENFKIQVRKSNRMLNKMLS